SVSGFGVFNRFSAFIVRRFRVFVRRFIDMPPELDITLKIYENLPSDSTVWENIHQIKKLAKPLDVLRLLTTNALYQDCQIFEFKQ
ncbi:hypothetical protein P4S72_27275, partial [Vibrio sp. PP-XX7]